MSSTARPTNLGHGGGVPPVHFHLELPAGPEWPSIEPLRAAVLNCLAAVLSDRELADSVAIVTGELLENAIKYGDWGRAERPTLSVRVRGVGDELRVEVASPVAAGSRHHENIARTLDWIRGFPSARDAYVARMQAIARGEEAPVGESRTGLVRIASEGPCAIDATLLPGDVLQVRATIPAARRVM